MERGDKQIYEISMIVISPNASKDSQLVQ